MIGIVYIYNVDTIDMMLIPASRTMSIPEMVFEFCLRISILKISRLLNYV